MNHGPLRIGAGSASAEDILELAENMAREGQVAYVSMDCLSERTLALGQRRKQENPRTGYDLRLPGIAQRLVPDAFRRGVKIIGNMGAAHPEAAAEMVIAKARELGLHGLRVACVTGDDVLKATLAADPVVLETGEPVSKLQGQIVCANAYLGIDPLVEALRQGAHVVITGRVADPSLFLAPMVYEFGWKTDDWDRIGAGTVIGHLMECGVYVTGGNFADPPYRVVEDLAHPSMPLAEVMPDGTAVITKLPHSGGIVSVNTCKAQLVYETHDPKRYITPDCTANFANVHLEQEGPNRVRVSGGTGAARPDTLKVLVGLGEGFMGEGQVSFAGPRALERAQLAQRIVQERLAPFMGQFQDLRFDFMGINALHGPRSPQPREAPYEVHLRVAGRTQTKELAERMALEVKNIMNLGPAGAAGGMGHRMNVRPVLSVYTTFIRRTDVKPRVEVTEVR